VRLSVMVSVFSGMGTNLPLSYEASRLRRW
jgi:hypothetical protein